jgi:para-aminobenzoate synthetase/4-amino-4-deoxychorismate lyase
VLHERPLTPADLAAADELAVVNSLRGWRPAVLF